MLLARLVDRVPELEASQETHQDAPGPPERAPEGIDTGQAAEGRQEATQRRSWWRRFFGFE